MILLQCPLKGTWTLDREESNCTIFERDGKRIALGQKYEFKGFYWNSEEYEFQLMVPCDMSNEEIFALIDSIVQYDP